MAYTAAFIRSFALMGKQALSSKFEIAQTHNATGCTGKESFSSRSLAAKVASRPRKAYNHTMLVPYHCPNCSAWHLGGRKKGDKPTKADPAFKAWAAKRV